MLFSGLDLGQAGDFAALSVTQASAGPHPLLPRRTVWHHAVKYLRRWPLGTLYISPEGEEPGVYQDVKALFAKKPLPGTFLGVDRTGVGRSGVDQLRAMGIQAVLCGITATSGSESRRDGFDWTVPKKDLVGTFREVLESGRLKVEARHNADVLKKEMQAFQIKARASGHESMEAEGSAKDDLLMSLMIAVWLAEQFAPWDRGAVSSGDRESPRSGRRPPSPFGARGSFGSPPRGVFGR